jgi:tetratricopeptide (TPR) repeat protein
MRFKNILFATIIFATTANAQSALKRGDAFVAQENYKAAIEEYSKVSINDANSYARAIYNIGVCHYELWQTEEAIIFYKRAIELRHGDYPRASYALGVALEDQGRLAEAKQAYARAGNHFAPAIYKLGVLEATAVSLRKQPISFATQPHARASTCRRVTTISA